MTSNKSNKKKFVIIFLLLLIVFGLLTFLYVKQNAQNIGRNFVTPINLKVVDLQTSLKMPNSAIQSKEWAALDENSKKYYYAQANKFKLFGLESKKPLQTKSNQDHAINQYYEYAALRLKKIKSNGKLNNQWLEAFFKDIPLWRQNLYAFEHTQDISYAKQSIEIFESEWQAGKLILPEIASVLAYYQDLPIELLGALPFWFYGFDLEFEKQYKSASSNALKISELMRAVAILGFDQKYVTKWNDLQETINKLDISTNYKERIDTAKNLLEAIYLAKEQGVSTNSNLLEKTNFLAQELMYLVEPDGCLPQLELQFKRENIREYLYYAAEIFDQNELRFLAYGGYRNPHIMQPQKTSVLLNSNQLIILRSNWNILWTQPILPRNRVYGFKLGEYDSSQIVVNLKTKEASFYAQNKPQFKFVYSGIDAKACELKTDQEVDFDGQKFTCDILVIPDGFTLTFIKKIGFWFLTNASPNLQLEIFNYRSEVTFENNAIISNHLPRRSVFYTYDDDVKYSGDFLIKGFLNFDNKIDGANQTLFEGYYNVGKISKCNELIVEANPNAYFPLNDKDQVRMMPAIKMNFLNIDKNILKLTNQFIKPTAESKTNEKK
jgi:hypothetical protein